MKTVNAVATKKTKTKCGIALSSSDHFAMAMIKRGLSLEGISPMLGELHQTKLFKRVAIICNGIILIGMRTADNKAELITGWWASEEQRNAIFNGEQISVAFGAGTYQEMEVLEVK